MNEAAETGTTLGSALMSPSLGLGITAWPVNSGWLDPWGEHISNRAEDAARVAAPREAGTAGHRAGAAGSGIQHRRALFDR
jgi:hypothetical protein